MKSKTIVKRLYKGTNSQAQQEQKARLEKAISEVQNEEQMFSYVLVSKKLGVSRERVRQLVEQFNLRDYRSIRQDKSLAKLEHFKTDPLLKNLNTARKLSVRLNLDEDLVGSIVTKQGFVDTHKSKIRKKPCNFLLAVKQAEFLGLRLDKSSISEIADFFHTNGILLNNSPIQIRMKIAHHKIDYKRIKTDKKHLNK
jgi:hypothetical protein